MAIVLMFSSVTYLNYIMHLLQVCAIYIDVRDFSSVWWLNTIYFKEQHGRHWGLNAGVISEEKLKPCSLLLLKCHSPRQFDQWGYCEQLLIPPLLMASSTRHSRAWLKVSHLFCISILFFLSPVTNSGFVRKRGLDIAQWSQYSLAIG